MAPHQPHEPPVYHGAGLSRAGSSNQTSRQQGDASPAAAGSSSSRSSSSNFDAPPPSASKAPRQPSVSILAPAEPPSQRRRTTNDRTSLNIWRARQQRRRGQVQNLEEAVASDDDDDAATFSGLARDPSDDDDLHIFRASSAPPYEQHQAPPVRCCAGAETFVAEPGASRPASPAYPSAALTLRQTLTVGDGPDPRALYISYDDMPELPCASELEKGEAPTRRSGCLPSFGCSKSAAPALKPLENPQKWSRFKKMMVLAPCFCFTAVTAVTATGYPGMQRTMQEYFDCSSTVFLLGSTTYLVMVAFAPLALAPLSETFGRRYIYLGASALFTLMFLPQALAPNIASIVVSRGIAGIWASVGNSVVAGTVSDLYPPNSRGLPMSIFTVLVYVGQAFSPWMTQAILSTGGREKWRWVFGFQAFLSAFIFFWMLLTLHETRGNVLLSRRARKLTKLTGRLHRCRADDERTSLALMVKTSLTRPFIYLFTEPVVLIFSLWVGVAWGAIFLSLSSVPIAFGQAYGYSSTTSSLILMTIALGGILGWLLNFHQEHLYHRAAKKAGGRAPAEARLYYACIGAVGWPLMLYMYAWGTRAGVHPAVGIIGFTLNNTFIYFIYTAVFSFMADCYERYASSSLAAQSFLRNLFAGVFPLFGTIMYEQLGAPIASTILASIAAVLGVVPFILFKYGDRLRQASRVIQQLEREEREAAEFMQHERERVERLAARLAAKQRALAEAEAQGPGKEAQA